MPNLEGHILKGRYRIEELIGRGGMAEVYKAWDTRRHYHVAIKVMREDLAEDIEFLERFKREASALSALSHGNIVRFYSFEREGPVAFIVMDYIEGTTLRTRILEAEGKPLPLEEVATVIQQVCAALYYAHSENVLHRDVKPGNIMIQPNGRVLIADFGIAKAADAATATTVMPGTPAYMSPEQCRSEMLDERADIYSLGIVVYEMLAGRRPFVGDRDTIQTGSTRDKIRWEQMHAEPPSLRNANPAVTAAIEAVVFKALVKGAAGRWATVLEFWEALEAALGVTVPAPAPLPPVKQPASRPEPVPLAGLEPAPGLLVTSRDWRTRAGWYVGGVGVLVVVVAFLLALLAGGESVPDLRGRKLDVALLMLDAAGFVPGLPNTQGIRPEDLWVVGQVPDAGQREPKGSTIYVSVESRFTATPLPSATYRPSSTPKPTLAASRTPAPTATSTATRTPTRTPTLTRTSRPPTQTPTPTPTLTATPKPIPSSARSRDGMQMIKIPAGEFLMGAQQADGQAEADERPPRSVYLETFWIDKTEVTNAQYARCVNAGTCGASRFANDGTRNQANQPVVGITWGDARAYCQWAGVRLPTEAEWEKAARGTEGPIYPWGNGSLTCQRANYWAQPNGCAGKSVAVGSYSSGASPYGVLDMAGNVWEWVNDWYNESYYSRSPAQDPQGPANGTHKVIRGGSWDDGAGGTRTTNRHREELGTKYRDLGFRCASSSAP